MSERDKSGERPGGAAGQPEPDPLSATGMFLNAFGKEPDSEAVEDVMAAPKARQPDPAATAEVEVKREPERLVASPSAARNQQGGPGEFTQMFQALKPAAPFSSDPAPAVPQPLSRESSSQAPVDGRIVVQPFPSASSPAAPATPSAPPATPPARRGFSSPGVSDSASSESSFTQHFRAIPTPPAAAPPASAPLAPRFSPAAASQDADVTQPFRAVPTPPVASAPATPPLAPAAPPPLAAAPASGEPRVSSPAPVSSEGSFTQLFRATPSPTAAPTSSFAPLQEQRRDTPFELSDRPRPFADSGAKPAGKAADPSVTELFRSLSSPDTGQASSSQSADPFASYTSPNAPPIAPAPPPASGVGGVTMLMNKLAEEDSRPAPRPAPRAEATSAPVDSGPGEFTRIISGAAFAASASAGGPAPAPAERAAHAPFQMPAAPPMPKVPSSPAFAPPPPASAAIPLMHHAGALPTHAAPAMPHAPAVPQIALPKVAIPAAAPPAVPAPKTKLQEMLPLLLVLNAFLLVVLIVIAFFALRSH